MLSDVIALLYRDVIEVEVAGGVSWHDVTDGINSALQKSGIQEGLCTIFADAHSSGILVSSGNRLLMEDFKNHFQSVSEKKLYASPRDAFVHIRASMLPRSVSIPISGSALHLKNRVFLWDFGSAGKRELVLTVHF